MQTKRRYCDCIRLHTINKFECILNPRSGAVSRSPKAKWFLFMTLALAITAFRRCIRCRCTISIHLYWNLRQCIHLSLTRSLCSDETYAPYHRKPMCCTQNLTTLWIRMYVWHIHTYIRLAHSLHTLNTKRHFYRISLWSTDRQSVVIFVLCVQRAIWESDWALSRLWKLIWYSYELIVKPIKWNGLSEFQIIAMLTFLLTRCVAWV